MHSLSLSFALSLSFSLSPSTLGASESRSYPSYTHAPLKRFYSAPPFPRNPPSLVSSYRDNARPYTTDCERGMSHPIRNFLLRFAPDHPRQLKSSTPSSRVHLDAPSAAAPGQNISTCPRLILHDYPSDLSVRAAHCVFASEL